MPDGVDSAPAAPEAAAPGSPGSPGAAAPTSAELALVPWATRSQREVYRNPWIRVEEHIVALPDGHETLYGVVRAGRAVGVLPFVDHDHVLMVGQYRYVAGRPTWEMPTGGVHQGETLVEAAQRELAEEAGVRAGELRYLTEFCSSKSVLDEWAALFVATDLRPATAEPDATELITRATVPFDTVVDRVLSGEIVDAMTIAAVLLADRARQDRGR